MKNVSEVVMITKMKSSKAKYVPKLGCKRNIPCRKRVSLRFIREIIKFSEQGSTTTGGRGGGRGGAIFPQICVELVSQEEQLGNIDDSVF